MSDDVLELTPPRALSKRAQAARRKATARLVKMHGRYGHGEPGVKCGGCAHLVSGGGGSDRTFWKYELYGNTRSEASDWRKRWPACGQYRSEGGPAGSASSRSSRGSQGNRPVGER